MMLCGADIGAGAEGRSNMSAKPRSLCVSGKSHVGGVRNGYGRPPLDEYFSSCVSFANRLIGLNVSSRSNDCMVGRWAPKKLLSCCLRGESCLEDETGL